MSKSDIVRLQHMLDAAKKAVKFVSGKKREDLNSEEILAMGLVRYLEIIGEASKTVSKTVRDDNVEIPWAQIARTRDRLIHGYFDVDLDIVWNILTKNIPLLIEQLENVLEDLKKRKYSMNVIFH